MTRTLLLSSALLSALALPIFAAGPNPASQTISVQKNLQIPGATLQPGSYTFSMEDHLADRAIVRISGPNNTNQLLLTVPKSKVAGPSHEGLVLFPVTGSDDQILRGWKCPSCASPVEFVYPKLEAVAITDKTTVPVLATDPEYDKLPANLSAEDMKMVTLWLLSPEKITAHKGEGVKAAKLKDLAHPASAGEVASASPKHMPKTASNTFSLILYGFLLLAGAAFLRTLQVRRALNTHR